VVEVSGVEAGMPLVDDIFYVCLVFGICGGLIWVGMIVLWI